MKPNSLIYGIILVSAVIGIIFLSGCIQQPAPPEGEHSVLKTEPIDLSAVQTEKTRFIGYYSLTPLDIDLQVSQYNLPLQTRQISNFNDFSTKISLSEDASRLLEKNGFVVIRNPFNPKEEYITKPYNTLK